MASGGVSSRTADYRQALNRYGRAREATIFSNGERQRDQALARLDLAIDALMGAPSPTIAAFGNKLSILQAEYGIFAQPRHLAAIYADAALLLWLGASIVGQPFS